MLDFFFCYGVPEPPERFSLDGSHYGTEYIIIIIIIIIINFRIDWKFMGLCYSGFFSPDSNGYT
jgi:hypothetical protein